jgi:hypothetical protein
VRRLTARRQSALWLAMLPGMPLDRLVGFFHSEIDT